MNAPSTSVATVAAAMSARTSDPTALLVDPATPGLAAVLVLFAPPSVRPTPARLRAAFADALDRAAPTGSYTALHAEHAARTSAFLATLPDVISPVAALGLAVRIACTDRLKWVHNGTKEGHSRWTLCDSHVAASGGASIVGDAESCAECSPDGTLTIDAGVPADIARALRAAYDDARGVVEPARIKSLVAAYLARSTSTDVTLPGVPKPLSVVVGAQGRAITDDVYLVPETTTATAGVLVGLLDLGGWATTQALADPTRIAHLSGPVTLSIEDQVKALVDDVKAFVARATAAADPTSTDALRASTGDTLAERIESTRRTAALWRDALGLGSLDCDALLTSLDAEADAAEAKALAAVEARRAARKAAKDAETAAGKAALAALDDEQATEERRTARTA